MSRYEEAKTKYLKQGVDVDKAITTRMNLSVKEIYNRFGEPFYRALETVVIKDLASEREKKVVSLGAGLPMQEQNHRILQ